MLQWKPISDSSYNCQREFFILMCFNVGGSPHCQLKSVKDFATCAKVQWGCHRSSSVVQEMKHQKVKVKKTK